MRMSSASLPQWISVAFDQVPNHIYVWSTHTPALCQHSCHFRWQFIPPDRLVDWICKSVSNWLLPEKTGCIKNPTFVSVFFSVFNCHIQQCGEVFCFSSNTEMRTGQTFSHEEKLFKCTLYARRPFHFNPKHPIWYYLCYDFITKLCVHCAESRPLHQSAFVTLCQVSLEYTAKTTTTGQLAHSFCTCVRGKNFPFQEVA